MDISSELCTAWKDTEWYALPSNLLSFALCQYHRSELSSARGVIKTNLVEKV